MRVHASALKHGVLPEDAVQAANWSQWIEPLEEDDWPHRELRVGFDTRIDVHRSALKIGSDS